MASTRPATATLLAPAMVGRLVSEDDARIDHSVDVVLAIAASVLHSGWVLSFYSQTQPHAHNAKSMLLLHVINKDCFVYISIIVKAHHIENSYAIIFLYNNYILKYLHFVL